MTTSQNEPTRGVTDPESELPSVWQQSADLRTVISKDSAQASSPGGIGAAGQISRAQRASLWATRHERRPRDLRFTGAVQTLLAFQGCLRTSSGHHAELLERFLTDIATHHIDGHHRIELRAIKRRPSKSPRLMKPQRLARSEAMRTKT